MFTRKRVLWIVFIIVACISLFINNYVYSLENILYSVIDYKPIDVQLLTRYNEDRVAFQHIQLPNNTSYEKDSSCASLLIIKSNQVYLFRDGYDDLRKIKMEGLVREMRRELPKDIWVNGINSKPDYVQIADRRTEKLLNVTEDFVEKNFGDFYRSVRNSLINKHVQIFKSLMRDRIESSLVLQRKPISPPAFQEVKEPSKYSTTVSAKTLNDTLYFAEDSDGDNITETFYVTFEDGFTWGFKSGPNIIFIYNNKEEDIKQLIGKLCYEAYYGTSEEEKAILKTFPKDTEIIESFKLEKVSMQAIQTEKPARDTGTGKK